MAPARPRPALGRAMLVSLLILALLPAWSCLWAATTTYTLKKGEGLSDVARKHKVPLQTLIRMNRSRLPNPNNPNIVYSGMRVVVPVLEGSAAASGAAGKPKPSPKPAPQAKPAPARPQASKPATPHAAVPAKPSNAPPPTPEASGKKPAGEAENRIFPKGKTLDTISPEAREVARKAQGDEAAARQQTGWTSPWSWGPVIWWLIALTLAVLGVLVWAVLRVFQATSAEPKDTGPLMLVARRSLGKSGEFYWFRADGKDLFISTGADAQIITSEAGTGASTRSEPVAAASSGSRRPRKNGPNGDAGEEGKQ